MMMVWNAQTPGVSLRSCSVGICQTTDDVSCCAITRGWKWKPLSHGRLCGPVDCTVHRILPGRILQWASFSFSRGSSQLRDRTQVSHIAGGFFTSWATRGAQEYWSGQPIPSPGDLPDSGIELGSPALRADSLPLSYGWDVHSNCRRGQVDIDVAGYTKLIDAVSESTLQCTFKNPSLVEFWCDVRGEDPYSSENLLQYSSHYIHMCKTGFSPYTYFKQKHIITMIWGQTTWECSWFLQPDVRNVHLTTYSLLENNCYLFISIWYLC